MSDERVRELVASESKRLQGLPIEQQVARMERFLDDCGLLERAERLINQLIDARKRWRNRNQERKERHDRPH